MVTCQFPCYHYCCWQDPIFSAPMRSLLCQVLCEHRNPEANYQWFPAPTVKKHFWLGGPFLHQENQRPGRLNLILEPNEDQAKHCREMSTSNWIKQTPGWIELNSAQVSWWFLKEVTVEQVPLGTDRGYLHWMLLLTWVFNFLSRVRT